MALTMNSVGIPGGFRGNAISGKIWGLGWFRVTWGLKRLLRTVVAEIITESIRFEPKSVSAMDIN